MKATADSAAGVLHDADVYQLTVGGCSPQHIVNGYSVTVAEVHASMRRMGLDPSTAA